MTRLDRALVDRGLVRSRSQGQELIDTGRVRVNGVAVTRAAHPVRREDDLVAEQDHYVSRAAHKLAGALRDLDLRPRGRVLDAGASTGGFTQVLLEIGVEEVIAVDVGTDQLDPRVGDDPRVRSRQRCNLRHLTLADLDDRAVDWVVADVSFISLRLLLPVFAAVTRADGAWLLMVKPQFEVGRDRLEAGGVVRSRRLRLAAVQGVVDDAAALGWHLQGGTPSRLPGPAGNQEVFVLLGRTPAPVPVRLEDVLPV